MTKLTEEQRAQRAATRRRKEALLAEDAYERDEAKRLEWQTNGTRLTREELEAGVACRGCGFPIVDRLGSWPALSQLTPEERMEHDAADADYKARHGNCHAHRWTMSGSWMQHCGFCCPPPPLSREQIESVSRLLSSSERRNLRELASWRLTLTCGHPVDRLQHRSHRSWTTRVVECPECARHRGVVESELLPDAAVAEAEVPERRETAATADESELATLRTEAQRLSRRIKELERTVGSGDRLP